MSFAFSGVGENKAALVLLCHALPAIAGIAVFAFAAAVCRTTCAGSIVQADVVAVDEEAVEVL